MNEWHIRIDSNLSLIVNADYIEVQGEHGAYFYIDDEILVAHIKVYEALHAVSMESKGVDER